MNSSPLQMGRERSFEITSPTVTRRLECTVGTVHVHAGGIRGEVPQLFRVGREQKKRDKRDRAPTWDGTTVALRVQRTTVVRTGLEALNREARGGDTSETPA